MCFPFLAITLAVRGEIQIGSDTLTGIRIFMLLDNEKGMGFQLNRKAPNDPNCIRTSIRYLLWEGEKRELNTDYCLCYAQDSGEFIGNCQISR